MAIDYKNEARGHLTGGSTSWGGKPITPQGPRGTGTNTLEDGHDFEFVSDNERARRDSGTPLFETGGTHYAAKRECKHDGTTVVWAVGNKTFAGAKGHSVQLERIEAVAVVDCADVVRGPSATDPVLRGPEKYMFLNKLTRAIPDLVTIKWRDYGVPMVGVEFWRKLYETLPDGRIVVCCVGSHGRTGTCLASFMITVGNMSSYDAIMMVRAKHCAHAIESKVQEEYLDSLSRSCGTYEPWEYRDKSKDAGKGKGKPKVGKVPAEASAAVK
jgi:hypothetical protein